MPINKTDIKLRKSQRLDDTNYGGGQATSHDVISGEINNLYPDISRLDRVNGRVSLRKAFLHVDTNDRSTYYGAHACITKNATDPNVSVCFFSDNDWFSQRRSAQSRIEDYLVQGPIYHAALWGNHFRGTKVIQMHTYKDQRAPDGGDVLVLLENAGLATEKKQYIRILKVAEELREFYTGTGSYTKKIIKLEIGEYLTNDFTGEEMFWEGAGSHYGGTRQATKIYTTVAADASKYYGISTLIEPATKNSTKVRVDSIMTSLLPAAQSSSAITDAVVGTTLSPLVQTSKLAGSAEFMTISVNGVITNNSSVSTGCAIVPGSLTASGAVSFVDDSSGSAKQGGSTIGAIDYDTGTVTFTNVTGYNTGSVSLRFKAVNSVKITRSFVYKTSPNAQLYIGEGVLPGSLSMSGGLAMVDDGTGNVLVSGNIIGAIHYPSGTIALNANAPTGNYTSQLSYIPAAAPSEVSCTGAIKIEAANRNFVYTYLCTPIPKKGTLKVEFLANNKWYTISDRGDGALRGFDSAVGSGTVNYVTGSVAITLGAMPDVGSMVMFYWSKDAPYYDLSGDNILVEYKFTTKNTGIARNTFICSWDSDNIAVMDDGSGNLVVGNKVGGNWTKTSTVVGRIEYATGNVSFSPGASQDAPLASENLFIRYSYGDSIKEEFNPIRSPDGTVTFHLSQLPVLPGTFKVTWHTDLEEYDGASGLMRRIDPTHTYYDDMQGKFLHEINNGSTNWVPSTINYTNGQIKIMPDRVGSFPVPLYFWRETGLFDENHVPLKEFFFERTDYRPAMSKWPTDGIFECEYRTTDGSNADSYYEHIPKTFTIKPTRNLDVVPGSVSIQAGDYYIVDIGSGRLYHTIDPATGAGTECGSISYIERKITIHDDNVTAKKISVKSAVGTMNIDPVQFMVFRTPGAPLVAGSLSIRATMGTGEMLTGSSSIAGKITGNGIEGEIDFRTGVVRVAFGKWEPDIYSAMPTDEQPSWYAGAPTSGGQVWHPYSVYANTVLINCTTYFYLPLDAQLLGIDPVRLPIDGKVPIFRDGYTILIHNTVDEVLPSITAGNTYNLSRNKVDDIVLYDKNNQFIPELDNGVINYTYDLNAGTVTIGSNANIAPYEQPWHAFHRIEDMVKAIDVQITGHIAINQPLRHDYEANNTMVSSILPTGDLQSAAYNEFIQNAWSNVWSDDLIGFPPLASYDFVNFPITVTNKGAIKERWLIRFTTGTTFDVVGEHLGVVLSGLSLVQGVTQGWTEEGGKYYLDVMNRLTGERYWRMAREGFSTGWGSGNCIRFNTDGCNFPYWFVRTTLLGPPVQSKDDYRFIIRGDSA